MFFRCRAKVWRVNLKKIVSQQNKFKLRKHLSILYFEKTKITQISEFKSKSLLNKTTLSFCVLTTKKIKYIKSFFTKLLYLHNILVNFHFFLRFVLCIIILFSAKKIIITTIKIKEPADIS